MAEIDNLHRRQVVFEMLPGNFGIFPILTRMPVIPDDAPQELREALARRRIVAAGHQCPCGASLDNARELDYRNDPDIPVISIAHAADCPGEDDTTTRLLRAWVEGADGSRP